MKLAYWLGHCRIPLTTALAVCLLPLVSAAQEGERYVVRDTASPCLNVRPEPDTDVGHFDCLPPGTQVEVIGSIPYWREIRLSDGRTGWAAKKFLEPADVVSPEPAPTPIPAEAWLEVHFVDVGQGDAIWIHTHDDGVQGNGIFEGRNIVIDGGPNSADHSNELLKYLEERAHHDAVIDALIVTHPHNDHYPGADGILRHFEVRRFYDPGFPKGGTAYPAFLDLATHETVEGEPAKVMIGRDNFDNLDYWGDELRSEILYSYPGVDADDGLGHQQNTIENNASIVLRIEYGDHSFLLVGDAEGKERDESPDTVRYVEKILLDSLPPAKLKATVLKAGHHGSETSSTGPFIEAVDPEIVIVLSGRRKYGPRFLPDQTVLRRFCAHNPQVRIYRTDWKDEEEGHTAATDQDGDHIVVRTNGTELEVQAFSAREPLTVPPDCP